MARKLSTKIFNTSKKSSPAQKGGVGYDNARENIDPHIKTKVVSTKEINTGKASIENLKADHIAEFTTGHTIVIDNNVDVGGDVDITGDVEATDAAFTGDLTAGEFSQIGTATDYMAYDPARGLGSGLSAGTYFYVYTNDTGFGRTHMTLEGDAGNGASRLLFKDKNSAIFISAYGDGVVVPGLVDAVAMAVRGGTEKFLIGHSGTAAREDVYLYIGNKYNNPDLTIVNVGSNVGYVGIGTGTTAPTCKLQVVGAIASATLTITPANDSDIDDIDVSGVNTIFVDSNTGAVNIDSFINGVNGQILRLVVRNIGNTTTITDQTAAAGVQKIYLHDTGNDLTILAAERGGVSLICDGSDWYDISHAKHV